MKATAKYILENKDSGNEQIVNDSLMFGMGLYTYAEDAIKSGIKYISGKNTAFKHIPESELENFLSYLHDRDGYLEF